MKKILFLFYALFFSLSYSQTTLSAGDIAILQYNSDGSPEVIKFLILRSIESGTTINFTDNGWDGSAFRTTEGIDTWTAGSNHNCGDIIEFTLSNIAFNASGDQIFAYQGTLASPSFIFGFNNSTGDWVDGTPTSRKTALPSSLTNGTNAVTISHVDNVIYDASVLSGSKATILSAICTAVNWGGSNTVTQTYDAITNAFTSNGIWAGSWSPSSSDNVFFNATIDGGYNTDTHGNLNACNCTINASRTLTINNGGTITIENNITNNGSIVVESGGSLVQETSFGVNTGTNYTVERTTTELSEEGNYTFWSSPLTSLTTGGITNAQLYYMFNDAVGVKDWVQITSSTNMTVGVGYAISGPTGVTYPLTPTISMNSGNPFNNGNISVSIPANTIGDSHFLGNPYPSAISAESFLADNSAVLGGTIYFWTHGTDDSAGDNAVSDYAMYTATVGGTAAASGGAVPDGNIASGQGFFAESATASNATASFTNSMRVAGNNTNFYRNASPRNQQYVDEKDRIWLNLTSENAFSQILIGFVPNATDGADIHYDGLRLQGESSASFYSIIEDKNYGIQGRSLLKKKERIPLGFTTSKTGSFKISIDSLEGKLRKSKIILRDKLLNIYHKLHKSDYLFTAEQIGSFDERFDLILRNRIKRKENRKNIIEPLSDITISKQDHIIKVRTAIATEFIKNIKVYTILGNQILEGSPNENIFQIHTQHFSKGLLIIKAELVNGHIITKKIII